MATTPIRRITLGILLLATAAFLAPHDVARAEGPTGTIRLGMDQTTRTLDPTQATGRGPRTIVVTVFDQLYEYHHLKRPFELVPCLARALPEVSEDGRILTIRLREGVRYADDACFPSGKGRAVTASDVVFCFKRLMDANLKSPGNWALKGYVVGLDAFAAASADVKPDPNRSSYEEADGYPPVAGLEAVDDTTLRITLVKPDPHVIWLLATSFTSIYPPEAIAKHGARFGRRPVGTGPYLVRVFSPGHNLVLAANPSYREEHYPSEGTEGDDEAGILVDAGRRLPLASRVVFTAYTDPLQEWLEFTNGKVDLTTVPAEVVSTALEPDRKAVQAHLVEKGIGFFSAPKLEIFYTAFNMADPVVGHPAGEKGRAIRRAFGLTMDKAWVRQSMYSNMVVDVTGPLLEDFPEHDEDFEHPWYRQYDESPEEALQVAREELAAAGLPGEEGIPTIEIQVLDDSGSRAIFERRKRALAKLGITVTPVYTQWPELSKRLKACTAQVWSVVWQADYPDAQNFLQLFYGPNGPDPNTMQFKNAEFDALYEEALVLERGPERTRLYREMQDIVAQECPWLFRFRQILFGVTQAGLCNYRHNDICGKYLKYLRVDLEARHAAGRR